MGAYDAPRKDEARWDNYEAGEGPDMKAAGAPEYEVFPVGHVVDEVATDVRELE